jgi:succinate dehydrogenase hydrophobic anchor subunit
MSEVDSLVSTGVNDDEMAKGKFYKPEVEAWLTGQWSDGYLSGIFSDTRTLITGVFMHPLIYYEIMSSLPIRSRKLAAVFRIEWLHSPIWSTLFLVILAEILGTVLLWLIMVYRLRKAVADRYLIEDTVSFWESWLCSVCLLMSTQRHIRRAQGYVEYKRK